MALEGDETAEQSIGASDGHYAEARAAFLSGDTDKVAPAEVDEEAAEDDSDLEDDEVVEAKADDDADLEDDKEDEEPSDKETARRIEQVRRADKHARESREREFAARESELNGRVETLKKEWGPRIEAAEKFERLAARASIDPVAVLQALGVGDDRYEYAAQVLYTLAKAKGGDEKAKSAAAQLMKSRELDEEITQLKKWREDRERAEQEREQKTAADREVDAFISSVTKAATDKTPLAKTLLKNDPDAARDELQIVAYKLAKESGRLPDAKAVMIAFEKEQRAKLRKLGIDPKARGAAAALTETTTETKPAVVVKKKAAPAPAAKIDVETPLTREDFVRLSGKYD